MIEWIVSSSILITVIIALRHILKGRINLRLQYALWGVVLLRLLIPFSIGSSSLSVINLSNAVKEQPAAETLSAFGQLNIPMQSFESAYEEVVREYESRGVDISALEGRELEALDYEAYELMRGANVAELLKTAALYIWIAGIAFIAACLVFTNLRFSVRLKRTRQPLNVSGYSLPVYVTQCIETPCLHGFIHPKIYVTPKATQSESILRHVLEHETTHYRHGDHIWSALRGVCLAIHWYHPLVWRAAILSRNDSELACDESTISRIGENERADYGRTLIGMTCQKRTSLLLTATTMTGSKNSIKERITLIAKKPKMAIYTLIAVILIAAVAVGCTFTGGQEHGDGDEAITIETDIQGDIPGAVLDYAMEYVRQDIEYYTELGANPAQGAEGYTITDAIITGLKQISTGTAGLNNSINMYLLEYRLRSDQPANVMLAGGMSMEDGWITEWGSTGQPYLLLFYEDSGAEPVWQRICVTNTDIITQDYGTPEMLAQYENAYTAAAIELYKKHGWESEVSLVGFSIQINGYSNYEEIGYTWAEEFVKQYVENTSEDSPLHSTDAVVLTSEMYAESVINYPKTIVYYMHFVCEVRDAKGFEQWYVGGAGPLSGTEYPEYEGWVAFDWFIVLEQVRDMEWVCMEVGSGGYGGWGYLNYEWHDNFGMYMESLLSESGDYLPESILRCLPFIDWHDFGAKWGAEGWAVLWQLLSDHCLTEGQVYGPEEETRMWSDIYPNDQAYRNMYVILAALNTDGAYSEGIADILLKQRNYDSEIFDACLEQLTADQRGIINMLLETAS